MLYFRSFVFVVGWGIFLGICWAVTAAAVDSDLFRLGTKAIDTPRQLCQVVDWGYRTQHKLMYAKVLFVAFAYIATFLATLVFAVFQRRQFHQTNNETTMQDYAALCYGDFHGQKGSRRIEKDLSRAIEEMTDEKVVGISMCWDFAHKEDEVMGRVDEDLYLLSQQCPLLVGSTISRYAPDVAPDVNDVSPDSPETAHPPANSGKRQRPRAKIFQALDWAVAWLMFGVRKSDFEEVEAADDAEMIKFLSELETLDRAYVVFESERTRNAAVQKMKRASLAPDTNTGADSEAHASLGMLRLTKVDYEPEAVLWQNLAYGLPTKLRWLSLSASVVVLTLLVWSGGFFYPYAMYITSYSYAKGSEPSFMSSFVFSLMVAVGNELMFLVVTYTVDKVGFHRKDTCEKTYLVFYSIGCFMSLIVDLLVTCLVVYKMAVGMKAVNHSGQLLSELPSGREVFEAYPMQKALGYELFAFAFPPCFLLPFLLEPFLTIYLPYHLARLMIGTTPSIKERSAEKYLTIMTSMELARYADLILNMLLATLILFFPGGYTLWMFGAFVGSHIYILLLDHYRVLRCVPAFRFDSHHMDTITNAMMALPCASMLACFIFKFYSLPMEKGKISQPALVGLCVSAFIVHCVVHVWLVLNVVPKLGQWMHSTTDLLYSQAAASRPCSWFSANPVHCLRSKYLFGDDPPCIFYVSGKQHLMEENPSIGIYYQPDLQIMRSKTSSKRNKADQFMRHVGTADTEGGDDVRPSPTIGPANSTSVCSVGLLSPQNQSGSRSVSFQNSGSVSF
jgi:hypothetical protein